jgi:hypothetical protein
MQTEKCHTTEVNARHIPLGLSPDTPRHTSTQLVIIKQAVMEAHTALMKGTNSVVLYHVAYSARVKNTFGSFVC